MDDIRGIVQRIHGLERIVTSTEPMSTMSSSVKAVLFDFSQTLVHSAAGFRSAEKEIQARLIHEVNPFHFKDASPGSSSRVCSPEGRGQGDGEGNRQDHLDSTHPPIAADVFLTEYRRLRRIFQSTSHGSRTAFWRDVLAHFGTTVESAMLEQWEQDYWDRVDALTSVFPETVGVLESLLGKYRLALISNRQGHPNSDRHQINRYPELARFFEVIVIAGMAGVPAKPDREPFKICLSKLGLDVSEAVYVGDDWQVDICGARDAGLRAVWLQHHAVRRHWPPMETDVPIVTSLFPLLELEKVLACSP